MCAGHCLDSEVRGAVVVVTNDPKEPQPVPGPRYTAPVPPPASLGFDLAKWNRMSRAERRAVLRYAKKRGK